MRTVLYDPKTPIPIFCVGIVFESKKQFKDAVKEWALIKRYALRYVRNEPTRVRYECKANSIRKDAREDVHLFFMLVLNKKNNSKLKLSRTSTDVLVQIT